MSILNQSAEICCWVLYILCNFGIMLKRVTIFFIKNKVKFYTQNLKIKHYLTFNFPYDGA